MDSTTLKDMLIRHEGLRLKPYLDSVGKLTIGVGRNLDDVGITKAEAMTLLDNDIIETYNQAFYGFPWFSDLSLPRQNAILDMIFNLGMPSFMGFKGLISAIQEQDWPQAKKEMLNSKWASQVGDRAIELAKMMETG